MFAILLKYSDIFLNYYELSYAREPVQRFLLQNDALLKEGDELQKSQTRMFASLSLYLHKQRGFFHKLSSTNHDDTEPDRSHDKFLVHFRDLIIR